MKGTVLAVLCGPAILLCAIGATTSAVAQDMAIMSKSVLQDKIKGAWAAQAIGSTFGSPVEFRYNSTLIQDYQKRVWYDGYLKDTYDETPGCYDDVYMDLAFVQISEDEGLDTSADYFAKAFANAEYKLWFANRTATNHSRLLLGVCVLVKGTVRS